MNCENEHYHGHNHGEGHEDADNHQGHSHTAPVPTNASQSLLSKIDTFHVNALNLSNPPDELQKLFKFPDNKYQLKPIVKSDCDSQLIINIPFLNGSVKLYSIILRTNGDKYCPRTIKFWKNESIDFDNATVKKPLYKVDHPQVGCMLNEGEDEFPESLSNEDEFVEHFLPRHSFTGVQQLTVFIEDIYGDEDECHLHYIELRGEFTELTRDPVITLYELAANPADHQKVEATSYSMNGL